MIRLFPASSLPNDQIECRLLRYAAVFLFLYCLILTLSQAVRLHTWQVSYPWMHWIGYGIWLVGFSILQKSASHYLPDRSPYILPTAALLTGLGLVSIWRLDRVLGIRQTIWLAVSIGIFWWLLRVPNLLGILRRYKYLWLAGGILLTVLTFLFGTYPGGPGPRLWLGCCGVYFQPSEPLKLLLIIYLAAYLADRLPLSFGLGQIITPSLILGGLALLVLLAQRDLGTAFLFISIYFIVLYLASGRRRVILFAFMVMTTAAVFGYFLFNVIHTRVLTWLDPWSNSSGYSYQIIQSLITVAAGKVFGSGPGLGNPGVVPVSYSDFIFSAISEETGLIGSMAVLILIALIAGRGLVVAVRANSNYQRYLAAGIAAYLSLQSILIIGGNLSVLPLTGVTLPFVSYGGSSLVTSFICLLLLCLISDQPENNPAPLPRQESYRVTLTGILVGLVVLALASGWWEVVRSDKMVNRPDNPRPYIEDRYVTRGSILDRHNLPIVVSSGQPGSYQRQSFYPPLSLMTGYTNPLYGQAGLESSLDAYLRGMQGTPSLTVWGNHLLYNQHPPGLDTRLSVTLDLQKRADELLGDHKGALVLINAQTGEILAMASHPYFNPNDLEEDMPSWLVDPNSPLVNRVTLGLYPPGSILGPFLLASSIAQAPLPENTPPTSVEIQGHSFDCALPVRVPTWGNMIANGCPTASLSLVKSLGSPSFQLLYNSLGFDQSPEIPLSVAPASSLKDSVNLPLIVTGQAEIQLTPLQIVLATAALSAEGKRPAPLLAMAVNTPAQGWVILPSAKSQTSLPPAGVKSTTEMLSQPGAPLWQSTATVLHNSGKITWSIGGTTSDWKGTPLAITVLLEEDNPTLAKNISAQLLLESIQPQ